MEQSSDIRLRRSRRLLVLNDHHTWVGGVYARVGEPHYWITLDDPAYVAWDKSVQLQDGPASSLVRLLVWAALEKPWGTWDNASNPVCSTHAPELGACVQLGYTIDKYGSTGKYNSIKFTRSGKSQSVRIS